MRATRSDSLADRLDQLADVYGEVLLGLYDDVTDQRERTEAVAARAEAALSDARRLLEELSATAPAPAPIEVTGDASHEADIRAHLDARLDALRAEVHAVVAELRQHVRELADAMTREAQQSARRAEAASSTIAELVSIETARAGEELKAQADVLAEQVRNDVAEFERRQREIEERGASFVAAARHAQELSTHLEQIALTAPVAASTAEWAPRPALPDRAVTDRLRRTERILYGTALVAVVAIVLSLWTLIS